MSSTEANGVPGDRTCTSRSPECVPVHAGHGSPAGHSSGPPTELSPVPGSPDRGCTRNVVRANAASPGNRAVTSADGSGVLVMQPLNSNEQEMPGKASRHRPSPVIALARGQ
jgi:hypothetical protein